MSCENCSYLVADMAPYTRTQEHVPSMSELLRHTIELHLKGGPGYACFLKERTTRASQLISAGRVFQIDAMPIGFAIFGRSSRDRSATSSTTGTPTASTSAIVSRETRDRFTPAPTRSTPSASATPTVTPPRWRTAAAQCGRAGALARQNDLAKQCVDAAEQLRASFVPTLMNRQTGWLAAWRSADGELHDYAFHIINSLAIIYGILDERQSRDVLRRLEAKRLAVGVDDFRYGLPPLFSNPLRCAINAPRADGRARTSRTAPMAADTFGIFINGGLTPCSAGLYLRALSQFGFTETADRLADQMLASFDDCIFDGSLNGAEAYTLDGMRSGYEGTLAHSFHVLLAIAQHKGWIRPLQPEWWPEESEV